MDKNAMAIKRAIKKVLLASYMVLPCVVRDWVRSGKVTILLYHEISPSLFLCHVKFLKQKFKIISLEMYKRHLYGEADGELPRNALVITFDDGWKSNFNLLPILREDGIPVTIFLTVGLVDTNRKIWNYTIDRMGVDYELNQRLKCVSNREKNRILKEYNGYLPNLEFENPDFLSMGELLEMREFVDFQSHGMYHPVLPMCSDEELQMEMVESKRYIQKELDAECYAFAYTYGRYGDREMGVARESGYAIARGSNKPGLNSVAANPYKLKSIGVDEFASVSDLDKEIAWGELISFLQRKN
jgi:peptidoglycan/xylan/chitin deacetylase (PgdA/CDA1 family)